MTAGRLGNVSGALLLGGRSRRSQHDAGRARSLDERGSRAAALLLDSICEETLLVGGEPEPSLPGRRVEDPPGRRGPLRGLVGALEAARAERVLVLATDRPGATVDLLLALVAWPEADAVVPTNERGDDPLCAIYRREAAIPVFREALETGPGGDVGAIGAGLERLDTQRVTLDDLGLSEPGGAPPAAVESRNEPRRREAR